MRILSLIHGLGGGSGLFGDAVRAGGHELDERSYTLGDPPPERPESYDAVMVFGGAMNVDETDEHPWIHDERHALERVLEEGVPIFGVCLGAQLLAAAAGARVTRAAEPEIGWYDVEVTPAAESDPLFSGTPERFSSFQWHSYAFEQPAGSVLLAASAICPQAYRLGDAAWGIQFHAEVTREIAADWISKYPRDPAAARLGLDPAREQARLDDRIGWWNAFGRKLVGGFLDAAARRAGVSPEPARA